MTWASDPCENNTVDEVSQFGVVYRPEFQAITYRRISLETRLGFMEKQTGMEARISDNQHVRVDRRRCTVLGGDTNVDLTLPQYPVGIADTEDET